MPVVEYMQHKEGHRRLVPEYILDRGHWYNPADHTFVGWVEENPDYYVPELVQLDKAAFVARLLEIHADNPLRQTDDTQLLISETPPPALTTEEVTALGESWYDAFVSKNTNPPVTPPM